jgi:hypothetical protein
MRQTTLSASSPGATTGGSASIRCSIGSSAAAAMSRSIGTIPISRRPSRTATSSAQSKAWPASAWRTCAALCCGSATGTWTVAWALAMSSPREFGASRLVTAG